MGSEAYTNRWRLVPTAVRSAPSTAASCSRVSSGEAQTSTTAGLPEVPPLRSGSGCSRSGAPEPPSQLPTRCTVAAALVAADSLACRLLLPYVYNQQLHDCG